MSVEQVDTVRISQDGIFYTLQGEGPRVGVPTLFVRLDTCNLRCKWGDTICDAHYTSWHPGTKRVSPDELAMEVFNRMRHYRCSDLVITGGEPCLQEEAVRLLATTAFQFRSHYDREGSTTIETNGTIYIGDLPGTMLICMSPKLSSSTPVGTKYEGMHSRNRVNLDSFKRWMANYEYYFKFVIDTQKDIEEACELLEQVHQPLPDPQHVCFMPQGIAAEELWERGRWLAEACKQLGVRFTPRLQIDLWGNERAR